LLQTSSATLMVSSSAKLVV